MDKEEEQILQAVHQNPSNFKKASEKLQNDLNIILKVLKVNPSTFKYIKKKFQNEKEIVLFVLQRDGWLLQFVNDDLKLDDEVVTTALKQTGYAFRFLLEKQKKNKTLVTMALKKQPDIFKLLQAYQQKEEDYILASAKLDKLPLLLNDIQKNDTQLMKKLLMKNGKLFNYYPDSYRKNREFCLIALKSNFSIEKCVEIFDKEMLYTMFDLGGSVHKYQYEKENKFKKEDLYYSAKVSGLAYFFVIGIPDEFSNDSELLFLALKKRYEAVGLFPGLSNDRELMLKAIEIQPMIVVAMKYCWMSDDEECLEKAFSIDGTVIFSSDKKNFRNRKFVKLALKNCCHIEDRRNLINKSIFKDDVELKWISMKYATMIQDVNLKN
eukprot:gene12820-7171_t